MLYVLLPIFNEEENIGILLDRIRTGMERRNLTRYQVVAYNDGSTDRSVEILQEKQTAMPLVILGKDQNEGLGFAFRTLLTHALAVSESDEDVAFVLDSDNTHNPEHIFQMLDKIRNGYDLAIASRYRKDSRIVGLTAFRKFLSFGASMLMRTLFPITGVRDYTCGYRAYKLSLLRRVFARYGDQTVTEQGFACMAELLIKMGKLGILAVEIPLVLRYDQRGGTSKMNVRKTVEKTLRMLKRLWSLK